MNGAESPVFHRWRMEQIITRKYAIEHGLKRYFTGKPCKNGHIAERQTKCSGCVDCRAERGVRKYIANRDCILASAKTPEARAKINIRNKKRYHANPELAREKAREAARKNPVDRKEYRRNYYLANREKQLAQCEAYRIANKDKAVAKIMRRRAAKLQSSPKWRGEFDVFVEDQAASLCILRNSATGIKWHIDHMIPLRAKTASGLHVAQNLQVIPARLNQSKNQHMRFTESGEWIKAL